MYFDYERSFYTNSWENRKLSLESVETSTSSSGNSGSSGKYKTELCKFWRDYVCCPFGLECSFAHGCTQLRDKNINNKYRTSLCKNFMANHWCPYGQRCQFSHRIERQNKEKQKIFYQSSSINYIQILEEISSLKDLQEISNRLLRSKPTILMSLAEAQDQGRS